MGWDQNEGMWWDWTEWMECRGMGLKGLHGMSQDGTKIMGCGGIGPNRK